MPHKIVKVNRAPVLTLWATIVAERLGYNRAEALTLGKAVAGLNAQSKGRRLGIFHEAEAEQKDGKGKTPAHEEKTEMVNVLGRPVPTVQSADGVRATIKGSAIDPDSVQRYLAQKFGESYDEVEEAMKALARAYPPRRLEQQAYALYEDFRPSVPEGEKGWGAKGQLDLTHIRSLADRAKK